MTNDVDDLSDEMKATATMSKASSSEKWRRLEWLKSVNSIGFLSKALESHHTRVWSFLNNDIREITENSEFDNHWLSDPTKIPALTHKSFVMLPISLKYPALWQKLEGKTQGKIHWNIQGKTQGFDTSRKADCWKQVKFVSLF